MDIVEDLISRYKRALENRRMALIAGAREAREKGVELHIVCRDQAELEVTLDAWREASSGNMEGAVFGFDTDPTPPSMFRLPVADLIH